MLVSLLLFIASSNVCNGGKLKKDFYGKDCPRLEETVRQITWEKVGENRSVAAKLLRLHFHDCFVRVPFFIPHHHAALHANTIYIYIFIHPHYLYKHI